MTIGKLLYAGGAAHTYAPGVVVLLIAIGLMLGGATVAVWAYTALVGVCLLIIARVRLHW